MINLLWPLIAFAGEPTHEIEVVAHKDIEVYVAPTKVKNESKKIEATIGDYSIFGYASQYKNLAKVKDLYGWTTMDYSDHNVNILNEDTIKYYWEDCDYKKEPKNCSYQNSHYLLESYITVDENQITLEMFLYNPDLQIISSSRETSTIKINWIKQQETTVQDNTIGSISGSDDSKDVTSASVSYAVASGVTAILGYTSVEASDEGSSSTDGSAWYIGANMAF